MDDLRFRSQQQQQQQQHQQQQQQPQSRNELPISSLVSPPRNGTSRMVMQQPSPHDHRANLPRRFTTDSSRVPTLASMTSPSKALELPLEYSAPNQTLHKVQLIEQKKLEYERIREQRRRFELEMQKLDQQQRREAQELAQMEEEIVRLSGHQSEPTTPPEYRDHNSGFPSMFSRPNRYSTSSLTSPPGIFNRPGRSGSQVTSPPSGMMQPRYGYDEPLPSRSVPTTRRNSDDEKEEAVRQDPSSHRSGNVFNRYSMPVTKSKTGMYEANLDQTNTTRFLFGDDEPSAFPRRDTPDHNFPTLVRRDDQILSASSAALDLALSPSPKPDASRNWGNVNRHRAQQSLSSLNINGNSSQLSDFSAIGSRPASMRHSLDLKYIPESSDGNPGVISPKSSHVITTPPKLQSSFSASEIPTVKSSSGSSMMTSNANNHAQQHFHNHNANMGRIPAGAVPTRHSRELSGDGSMNVGRDQVGPYQSLHSALQASAAPFGPSMTSAAPFSSATATSASTAPAMNGMNGIGAINGMNGYAGYYPPNGYQNNGPTAAQFGGPMLAAGMQQMNLNGVTSGNMYPVQNFSGYNGVPFQHGTSVPQRDSQARVIQNRRQQLDPDAMSRYQNMPLESFRSQIYDLCKDQHGCRYLQKKLEERNPDQVHMIWLETNQHVIELMTDPFGNYLCQKLLEFCNDDERTVLIQNASQDMVRIALNQHGTRALQKMIEYVNTPQQVHLIIEALQNRVVELIQDLNGNHVIQKCLNKLTSADAQFIFDAVGKNCIEVGTHRHGCCVLQRCIDHASGDQKQKLVRAITAQARILVQDPFGNYVVQYIIDLNEPTFTEPVVATFKGCIGQLSRHKFSSNVIEKCLRCAQPPSKDMIVGEMLVPAEIERLLRDSFANYVIQTALEFATPQLKYQLVEAIRPFLPQIRTTPYGRRIQAKISAYDGRGSAATSGQVTPADNTQGQIPLRPAHARGVSGTIAQNNLAAHGTGVPNNGAQTARQSLPSYNGNGGMASAVSVQPPVQQPQFGRNAGATNGSTPPTTMNGGAENMETRWV
ncbi:Armadillo-like helical [Cordyceps fumosorosea ARSEF 2679]|uniref:Armadillo-like helical n=1 Tax=Cordyceps fumosorosea (strain ARSEF 2679) TaxID=1081104 RepID=A0A167S520_CORFA|nr:Armadillo-like helical [Cordyceps fumosorosea ARSEF 2679]OAA59257.1 Armadillo-like helical [Cordyceps fumosorosea ARSEF 2679]